MGTPLVWCQNDKLASKNKIKFHRICKYSKGRTSASNEPFLGNDRMDITKNIRQSDMLLCGKGCSFSASHTYKIFKNAHTVNVCNNLQKNKFPGILVLTDIRPSFNIEKNK